MSYKNGTIIIVMNYSVDESMFKDNENSIITTLDEKPHEFMI